LPSCIIFPKAASEVATIVKILNNNTEPFAIKSGGHNPNNYFSSVAGGPVISTASLDQATLDPATGIVDVGPGNRLDGIAAKLQGSGWTFVGGRIGNTGVGGLVLGGGLSYMSTQYVYLPFTYPLIWYRMNNIYNFFLSTLPCYQSTEPKRLPLFTDIILKVRLGCIFGTRV
jgi:hypothetical protein